MISRSVAQIATASIRTSTSARCGTGTGFCPSESWPGSPSTHAFIWSGIGKSGLVFTPAGAYIAKSSLNRRCGDRCRIRAHAPRCAARICAVEAEVVVDVPQAFMRPVGERRLDVDRKRARYAVDRVGGDIGIIAQV